MATRRLPFTRAELEAAYRAQSPECFRTFLFGLLIPSQTGTRRFVDCIAPHQSECFEHLAPNLHALRDGLPPATQRYWIERTKKAAKDADLAIIVLWLVAFARRPFLIEICAGDEEQAAIVKDRVDVLLFHNPWLADYVGTSKHRIYGINGLASAEIEATDVGGSHGSTPDLLVINEATHIVKWQFVQNKMSNAAGVAQGMMIVATNAGYKGTAVEVVKQRALEAEHWQVFEFKQPAPWTNPKLLADERSSLTTREYKRLWEGEWSSGKGDAVTEDAIEAAFSYGLTELDKPEPGWRYISGLDLGTKLDRCGHVVVGVSARLQRIRVATMRRWDVNPNTGEIDLIAVQEHVRRVSKLFRCETCYYDPDQAVLMAQQLRQDRIGMEEMRFSPSNLTAMANAFVVVMNQRQLQCYADPDGDLRRDFGKFSILERPFGNRLEATRDEYGHADVGTALIICLPAAVEMLRRRVNTIEEDEPIVVVGDTNLNGLQESEIHPEMLGIINAYGRAPAGRVPSKAYGSRHRVIDLD